MTWRRLGAIEGLACLLLALWPQTVRSPYLTGVAITTLMYVALAFSFDLVVGRIGLLSFAHAGFFGTGAYISALAAVHLGWAFPLRLAAAVLGAVVVAIVIGIPSFRLSYHSFAISTLAFAVMAQLVATNWIAVTRGPLCLPGVPPVDLRLGTWRWEARSLPDYYYLALGLAILAYLLVRRLAQTRIGRTWVAIREDEHLASAAGVPILKYKMLAFTTGAAVSGAVGAYYASYASVVCPSELAFAYTVNLIVILFLGGRGTIAGPLLGAIVFTALPEFLRIVEAWRLVIYGLLIILGAIYLPDGIVAWASRQMRQVRRTA